MTRETYKEKITKTVLYELDSNFWTFEKAMKKWWQNPRRDGGLRLTPTGDLEFRHAKMEYTDHLFTYINISYYSFVLELDKKIKCPYYIDVSKSDTSNKPYIRLYDSRIAMMLNLYGDLDSYLNSIKVRK